MASDNDTFGLSASDLRRFAICLVCTDKNILNEINWAAAAATYDPKVLPASFKTVTMKSYHKARKLHGQTEGGTNSTASGDQAAAGKKHKRTNDDEDGTEAKKPRGRPKKAARELATAEEDGIVKGEEDEENVV